GVQIAVGICESDPLHEQVGLACVLKVFRQMRRKIGPYALETFRNQGNAAALEESVEGLHSRGRVRQMLEHFNGQDRLKSFRRYLCWIDRNGDPTSQSLLGKTEASEIRRLAREIKICDPVIAASKRY